MSWLQGIIKENMKDPEFAKEWEKGEAEYQLRYNILDQLIKGRKRKNMTQLELAEKLDIAQSAIGRIESGKQNLTLDYISNIADALGYTVKIELVDKEELEHV
ncbi:putative transcriptional regulator [Croceifilum oryzae]|uniref:Transcriptional regulator n=1 Tax=Croceifilum oryzae TaxID=1553429 RepID=A0AAJ1TH24_9BACL|nr:helix-turn-helix transcriptional regulator [Croceifilum oryzae]MDQ0418775.1 putative transcriptional regulator [Croceifilum oryzae]